MREIKCRGKRIDNGKWVEGYYCKHIKRQLCPMGDKLKEDDVEHIIFFDGFADWNMPQELRSTYILPETVGQYTGMKDKNGTEIYEGDVLIINGIRRNNFFDDFFFAIGKVIWNNGWFVECARVAGVYTVLNDGCINVEVIGNIHDNPELMEE